MSLRKRFLGDKVSGERRNQDPGSVSATSSVGSIATTATWRSRPVFISSTFRDMHAERDYLRYKVFPELDERLRQRRHYLEPIDLRLGVETASLANEQTRELQVLKVCLNEIERSRPFLIVLLGDRYGWVPPEERIAAAAQEAGFSTETKGKSVTALEIEFGILKKDPAQRRRSLFYFREPLPYDQMPAEFRAVYSDAYSADPAMHANTAKLSALKERIQTDIDLRERVRPYQLGWDPETCSVTGLETWGQQVLEELWADLDEETREYAEKAPATLEAQECESLAEFVDVKLRDFRGREEIIERLLTFTQSSEALGTLWGICVTGGPGSGKSSLFARVLRDLETKKSTRSSAVPPLVLAHAAGITPRSAQVNALLRRWVGELAYSLDEKSPVTDKTSIDELEKTFAALLRRAANKRRVVLLIDALNQFEPTARARYLSWLPRQLPANVRLIATALPGSEVDAFIQRGGVQRLELPPLKQREAEDISRAVWRRYRRECNPEVLARVLSKRRTDGAPAYSNPLWLTLAMEQLNLLDADDFSRAGQNLQQFLLEMASELPPYIDGLYEAILVHAEKVFGAAWARAFVCLVTLSRAGWREADLRVLLPDAAKLLFPEAPPLEWDPLKFAALRRGLRAQLIQRGSYGRWDFTHVQMHAAVMQRYLAAPTLCRKLHGIIANHLLDLPADDPLRESETMFHLIGADDRPRAARFYADIYAPLVIPEELLSNTLTPLTLRGEATRTLALHVLLTTESDRDSGLEWAISLLGQPGLEPMTTWNLCNQLQYDLNDELENAAPLGVRLRLLDAVRSVLDRLVTADPTKAVWRRDLAVCQGKISDVLHEQGNLTEAIKARRNCLDIQRRLVEEGEKNSIWRFDLAESHQGLGDLLRLQGKMSEARDEYRSELVLKEQLVAENEEIPYWQSTLMQSLGRTGRILLDMGNLAGALEKFQAQLDIAKRMGAASPKLGDWQVNLALSHSNIGNVLEAQGNLKGALEAYQACLDIQKQYSAANPGDVARQMGVSRSYRDIGSLASAQGDWAGALKAYQTSLEIAQHVAEVDPTNAVSQSYLAECQRSVGDIWQEQGDLSMALKAYRASIDICERLAASDPTNAIWQLDLSKCHDDLGHMHERQGNLINALAEYQTSLKIREQLAELGRENPVWLHALARSSLSIGDVLETQGDLPGALKQYRRALDILQRLATTDKTNAGWQRDLATIHGNIGDVLRWQEDFPAALEAYQACLDVFQRLVSADPTNARWQRDLSVIHNKVGDVLSDEGKQPEALEAYKAGFVIAEHLAKSDPTNITWQNDLSISHGHLGDIRFKQQDLAGALKAYRSALEIDERLAAIDPSDVNQQWSLAVSRARMGKLLHKEGDLSGALKMHQSGLEILKHLADIYPGNVHFKRNLALSYEEIGDVLRAQGDRMEAQAAYRSASLILKQLRGEPIDSAVVDDIRTSQEDTGIVTPPLSDANAKQQSPRTTKDLINELINKTKSRGGDPFREYRP